MGPWCAGVRVRVRVQRSGRGGGSLVAALIGIRYTKAAESLLTTRQAGGENGEEVMTDVGCARTGWRAPPATVGLGLRVWGNLGFRHSLASGAGM